MPFLIPSTRNGALRNRTTDSKGLLPIPSRSPLLLAMLCGVTVYPGVHFAFFPSQVLADPVGGQFPFPPFLADGSLGNGKYRGYFPSG